MYGISVALVFLLCFASAYGVCSSGQYGISSLNNSKVRCRDCSTRVKCPSGMGVTTFIKCGSTVPANTHVECEECVAGTNFSIHHDEKPCQPCTSCHSHEQIDGVCTIENDSIKCNGVCEKGFYPGNNNVKNCTPCSKCYSVEASVRNNKCEDDHMPRDMQCEFTKVVPTLITQDRHSDVIKQTSTKEWSGLQPINGHYHHSSEDSMYRDGFFILIGVIGLSLFGFIFFILKKKCRKRKYTRTPQSDPFIPLQSMNAANASQPPTTNSTDTVLEMLNNGNALTATSQLHASTQTDSDIPSILQPSSLNRRSSSSASDRNRKVSFSDMPQKSVTEHIPEDDEVEKTLENEQKSPTMSVQQKRSSTTSLGSVKGVAASIIKVKRQNSSPVPDNREGNEEGRFKRSKTFSNLRSIYKKIGDADDTKPFLASDDDDDDSDHNHDNLSLHVPSNNTQDETKSSLTNDDDHDHDHDLLSFETDYSNTEEVPSSSSKLPERVDELNAGIHGKLCRKLNVENEGRDWRTLAGRMGDSIGTVHQLKGENNPAGALLLKWGTVAGNNVAKLVRLLKDMQRDDLVCLLLPRNEVPMKCL